MSKTNGKTSTPSNSKAKALRFAVLNRVSTEQQEKHGESLRTQRTNNERDATRVGGKVVEWYGGQEHATPGYEKKEINRLLADAAAGKFDAVMVAYADRWSRDNEKSMEGLELFKQHGIRFFVGGTEYNLFLPEHELFLGMSAVIGKFTARQGSKKSIENRIERAKRGWPTCGKLPFGRTFDKETGKWSIIPEKQALIAEIADRIIGGESLQKLTKEFRLSHSNICKTLHHHCGEEWEQVFTAEVFNIREVVRTAVPRLLQEPTIRAVRQRLEANRTCVRKGGRPVHEYILSGHIFCAACGHTLTGQVFHRKGPRYYRHGHAEGAANCPLRPRPCIRADRIEAAVIHELFGMFGNPAAIERAVKAAVPDCDEALKRQRRLTDELKKIGLGRERLLGLVVKGAVTEAHAEKQLLQLTEQEETLRSELDKLDEVLRNVPDKKAMRCYVEEITDALGTSILVYDDGGNPQPGGNDLDTLMSTNRADKRALIEAFFHENMPDGSLAGVYVTPDTGVKNQQRGRGFCYDLRGRFAWRTGPRSSKGGQGSAVALNARQ